MPTHTSPLLITADNYLQQLKKIELKLPELLIDENQWQSLDIDYHPPRVERVYMQLHNLRIALHRIHPVQSSGESLFHHHPWPSAIKIIQGSYQMGVGYSENNEPPSLAANIVLAAGSSYEMINPNGWHYVAPSKHAIYSLMVSGPPWPHRQQPSHLELQPLSAEAKLELINFFRIHYANTQANKQKT